MSETGEPRTDPWTEDDFDLPFGPELSKLLVDEEEGDVSAASARKMLKERLLVGQGGHPEGDAEILASLIVRKLPKGAMNEQFLSSLDLRPYIQVVIDKPGGEAKWRRTMAPDRTVKFEPGQPEVLLERQEANEQMTLTEEFGPAASDKTRPYTTAEVGLSAGASIGATGQKMSTGEIETPEDGFSEIFGEVDPAKGTTTGQPVFPEEDLIQSAGLEEHVFDQAIQAEMQFNDAQVDFFTGELGTPGVQRGGVQLTPVVVSPTSGAVGGRKLSYLGARNFLFEMDENELSAMQTKMAKAGYYDKLGVAPILGQLDDGATQQAWDMLLVDAWKGKTAITSLLVKRGAEYRSQVRKRNDRDMIKNWQADTRSAADAMAIEQLGRRLTSDEAGQLTSFLQGLRTDRQDDIVGVDDVSYQTDQTRVMGFDDREVQRKVEELISGERSTNSSYDAWQGANDYFGVETASTPTADADAPGGRTPVLTSKPGVNRSIMGAKAAAK